MVLPSWCFARLNSLPMRSSALISATFVGAETWHLLQLCSPPLGIRGSPRAALAWHHWLCAPVLGKTSAFGRAGGVGLILMGRDGAWGAPWCSAGCCTPTLKLLIKFTNASRSNPRVSSAHQFFSNFSLPLKGLFKYAQRSSDIP